jgi:taurine transport system substrate-binding protein
VAAVFLAFAVIVSFTACGNDSTDSADNSSANENVNSADNTEEETENSGQAADESAADLPEKIVMGYWESPNGELLTKETKALEAVYPDVEIEWVEFQSGTDILTAIQSGTIDFATIGTPPVALGVANNYPFKIFYLHDVIGESEGLIVKQDSGIASLEDLKGKTVAVPFGTTSHFAFLNILKANDIDTTELTILDMTASDLYAAWQRGDIDGAYIWESVKSQLLEDNGLQLVSSADAAEVGGLTAEVGIVRNGFYEQYPDVVKAYIDVLDASVQQYRNDPDGSAKLMAGGLALSEEETVTAMNEIIVKDKSEQAGYLASGGELETTLRDTIDFLTDQGSITVDVDDDKIADAILSELYE